MTRLRWRWSDVGLLLVSQIVVGCCCLSYPAEAAPGSSTSTRLRYRVVDDDMRLLEAQEIAMYPHRRQRKLGAIGTDADPLATLWREHYDADYGGFLVPVKFGEDDSYEGSNSMSAKDEETTKLLMETMSAKLGGVVRFVFDGDVDNARFGDRYLRVGYFGSGCWSYVGRVPDAYMPQVVNLAPSCVFTDTVEHEIMHALGFYHEQSRPDRNDYVTIHWENIQVDRLSNFEIADGIDSRGVPYDRHSVMHYHSTAFSKDGSETITSTDPSDPSVGDASQMSASDMLQLRMLYRCSGSVREALVSNCDASCPCSAEGEGKCVSDDGCASPLRCDQESGLCSSLLGGHGNGNGNGTGTSVPTVRPTPFPAVTRAPTSANSDVTSTEGEGSRILRTNEGKAGLAVLVLLAIGIIVAMFY